MDKDARQSHRRVGVNGDEELPLLRRYFPELDRMLPVIAAHRRLANAGIVDKDVDSPKTAARLRDDLVNRLVAGEVGLDRHQVGALLPLLRRSGQLGETLGSSVDCRYFESVAEQSQDQLAADTAGSTRNNRHTLLFAHPLLPCVAFHPGMKGSATSDRRSRSSSAAS